MMVERTGNYIPVESFRSLRHNLRELRKSNDLWAMAQDDILGMIEDWIDELVRSFNVA